MKSNNWKNDRAVKTWDEVLKAQNNYPCHEFLVSPDKANKNFWYICAIHWMDREGKAMKQLNEYQDRAEKHKTLGAIISVSVFWTLVLIFFVLLLSWSLSYE